MKFITWVKSLSWIVIVGAVGTAIVMILNAFRAGKMEAEVEHGENRIKELNKGTTANINRAKILQHDIAAKKIVARTIRKKSEASLERLGQNETMADIAKRFNGQRVRQRSDPAA